jgi:hypothetical protein
VATSSAEQILSIMLVLNHVTLEVCQEMAEQQEQQEARMRLLEQIVARLVIETYGDGVSPGLKRWLTILRKRDGGISSV